MDLHLRFRFAGPPGQMVRMVRAIALLGLVVAPPLMAADPPAATSPASSSAASDGLSGAAFLEKTWPDHPEWLAMVADIIVRGDRSERKRWLVSQGSGTDAVRLEINTHGGSTRMVMN